MLKYMDSFPSSVYTLLQETYPKHYKCLSFTFSPFHSVACNQTKPWLQFGALFLILTKPGISHEQL